MKTREQQELEQILKSTKADIAVMLVNVQSRAHEKEADLRAENATLKARLEGLERSFKLLELMAGESNLGLKLHR